MPYETFFLEFALVLFQDLLCDVFNMQKCFDIIYFWHIFYATIRLPHQGNNVKIYFMVLLPMSWYKRGHTI